MGTLRAALAAARPHVSLKAAFTALVRQSRTLKASGKRVCISGRADIERWVSCPCPSDEDVSAIKVLLHQVVHDPTPAAQANAAAALNQIVQAHLGPVQTSAILLTISGGPKWLDHHALDRWLGTSGAKIQLEASEAARWIHHLDGMCIGGAPIHAVPDLDADHSLPHLDRKHRGRGLHRGQTCWLPHTDEVGRYSATPRALARYHGKVLASLGLPVFDPCCGLGGDAIGAALAGASVLASDVDLGRLELARRNAAHFGVAEAIEFSHGDAADSLRKWSQTHPNYTLFLDPPWGGPDWANNPMDIDVLLRQLGEVHAHIAQAARVVFKLPRPIDTEPLDRWAHTWEFRLGIDSLDDHMADRVRLISAIGDRWPKHQHKILIQGVQDSAD